LNYVEDASGSPDVPVAILAKSGKVTMLQMDSKLGIEEFEQVLSLAVEGCKTIHKLMTDYVSEYTLDLVSKRGVFTS
jgi:exosome complex component RRP41